MDPRIQIRRYYRPISNSYSAYVRVNGEPYAMASGPNREAVFAEALHYAMQIEFDENGNW